MFTQNKHLNEVVIFLNIDNIKHFSFFFNHFYFQSEISLPGFKLLEKLDPLIFFKLEQIFDPRPILNWISIFDDFNSLSIDWQLLLYYTLNMSNGICIEQLELQLNGLIVPFSIVNIPFNLEGYLFPWGVPTVKQLIVKVLIIFH